MISLLVFWLHAQCHLPFRACNAILVCLALIFKSAGIVLDPPMYSTLPSVMTALRADPIFQVCPVCPTCRHVRTPNYSFNLALTYDDVRVQGTVFHTVV